MSVPSHLAICHLTKYYPPARGGIESHVQTLAREQVRLGHRVTVVCVDHRSSRDQAATMPSEGVLCDDDQGVRVLRLHRTTGISKWDYCPALSPLVRKIQSEGVDIFHLHTPNPTMTLSSAVRRLRNPLVITHHSDVVKQRLLGPMLEAFERPLRNSCARILTTSPLYAAGSKPLQDVLQKVGVLPLGIDLTPFSTPSDEASKRQKEFQSSFVGPIWLSVGRLVYYKGLSVAIRAMRSLPGQLLIVGSGGQQKTLHELATRLGIAEKVVFLGELDSSSLVGAYHAATALLFPSNARSEAFGLVQVEAMASGCPVINTAIPHSGVSWVSLNGETGLTIPVDSEHALIAAAQRLLTEPGLRQMLAENAIKRAREMFDMREMAIASVTHYRNALANNCEIAVESHSSAI